ncbi:hypothetical protein ACRCUN_13910 [Mycobacterium sp. LTG2003]
MAAAVKSTPGRRYQGRGAGPSAAKPSWYVCLSCSYGTAYRVGAMSSGGTSDHA